MNRRVLVPLAFVLLVFAGCTTERPEIPEADRVLVVAIPETSWADLEAAEIPHLDRFFEGAALANLSTRIGDERASLADAYLTIGAGTRSVGANGRAFGRDETLGRDTVAQIVQRRTGRPPTNDIVHIDIAHLAEENRDSQFGGRVGRLGSELEEAGIAAAVVGNADRGGPVTGDLMQIADRSAVLSLMDRGGEVAGSVGSDLLIAEPDAPFGARLDAIRVLAAVDEIWNRNEPSVVLVECSDVARARGEASNAQPSRSRAMKSAALRECDEIVGALVARQSERDALIVLSPTASGRGTGLGFVAVDAPGAPRGLLESASTRRAGYLQLSDVGPTILDLMGVAVPSSMEGNGGWVSVDNSTGRERIDRLTNEIGDAANREELIPSATALLVILTVLIALAGVIEGIWGRIGRRRLEVATHALFGGLTGSYLAALFPGPTGAGLVGLSVVVSAAVFGIGGAMIARRRSSAFALVVSLGLFCAMFVIDLLLGAYLQFNTLFGYSAAVAGRFAGLGNLAFALFGAAALVLAVIVGSGDHPRRLAIIGVLFATTIVVEGMPMWGGDVGGVLAMVPAFVATYTLLSGRQIRWWHPFGWAGGAVVAILTFGLIDLLRPPELRTHLGRYLDEIRTDGWGSLLTTVGRRLEAGLGGPRVAIWTLLIVAGLLVVEFIAMRRLGESRSPRAQASSLRAIGVGAAILGVTSLATNDAGLAAPLTMLSIIVPAGIVLFVHHEASA